MTGRVTGYVAQCSDVVVEDYIPRALVTGGFGAYPINSVRTERNSYVLSFSAEGVSYGVYDPVFAEDLLLFELVDVLPCVEPLVESDDVMFNDGVVLEDFYYDASFEDNVILVNYTFVYSLQGNNFSNSVVRSYSTNLGYFLSKTNELTDFFLEERGVDNFFNYQFCRSLVEERGFAPKYSADFLRYFEEDDGVRFLFDREFFVVFLERGGEVFPFAVMPFHDGYFC